MASFSTAYFGARWRTLEHEANLEAASWAAFNRRFSDVAKWIKDN